MSISWTNLYPGVDHATGTNPTDSPTPNNVNILRVDLTNPQIALTSTPKKLLSPEGVKTTEFLSEMFRSDMLAMFAINANSSTWTTGKSRSDYRFAKDAV